MKRLIVIMFIAIGSCFFQFCLVKSAEKESVPISSVEEDRSLAQVSKVIGYSSGAPGHCSAYSISEFGLELVVRRELTKKIQHTCVGDSTVTMVTWEYGGSTITEKDGDYYKSLINLGATAIESKGATGNLQWTFNSGNSLETRFRLLPAEAEVPEDLSELESLWSDENGETISETVDLFEDEWALVRTGDNQLYVIGDIKDCSMYSSSGSSARVQFKILYTD